jgi:hypothetical protein
MGITITNSGQGSVVRFRNLGRGGVMTSIVSPSALLLDTYPGAAAAYSLRKLNSSYTGNCIRVFNFGTGLSTDIGFVNNVLDVATLQTFIGGSSGFITIWYDQSGNGNNAVQPTTNNSPRIILSGVLQTLNGKPAIDFTGHWFDFTTTIAANTNLSIFMTAKGKSLTLDGPMLGGNTASPPTVFFGYFKSSIGSNYALGAGLNGTYNFVTTVPNYANTDYLIYNTIVNSSSYIVYQNNNTFTQTVSSAGLSPTVYQSIGKYANTSFTSHALFSELVIYKTDQTANRLGIVSNTNTYYSIY